MSRRRFLAAFAVAAGWPDGLLAQQRTVKIGMLSVVPLARTVLAAAVVRRLEELGFRQGRNMQLEYRFADAAEGFPSLARELVALKCDLIFAVGPEAPAKAMRDTPSSIPVVFLANDYDPVERGIVRSLGRPEGNMTGIYTPALALAAKRMQILREVVPSVRRALVFSDPYSRDLLAAARKAADATSTSLSVVEFDRQPYDLAAGFESGARDRVECLLILSSPVFYVLRDTLAEHALKRRLPSVGHTTYAEAGALLGYGVDAPKVGARVAEVGVRILKGAKPGDIPVEQVDDVELAINVRTAKALGVKVPESALARATRLIE